MNAQNTQQFAKFPIDDNPEIGHTVSSAAGKVATSPVVKGLTATGAAALKDSPGSPESESNELPDSLQCLSKRNLIRLLRLHERRFDEADLRHWCGGITARVKVLRARAREGKCVEEASEFARWVVSSGLFKLFEGEGRRELGKLLSETQWDCECHWKNESRGPWVAKSELESVNAKLDLLMARMASKEISLPLTEKAAEVGNFAEPALHVIQGGVS